MNYSKATLSDVPAIVTEIRALREVGKRSNLKTTRTQSQILRELPADVLTAVAVELVEVGGFGKLYGDTPGGTK